MKHITAAIQIIITVLSNYLLFFCNILATKKVLVNEFHFILLTTVHLNILMLIIKLMKRCIPFQVIS